MKNGILICDQSLKSENGRARQRGRKGRKGNKFLSYIACLFSYSADTKIYAKCNKAEMAAGYCFAFHLNLSACVRARACVRVRERGGTPLNK